MWRRTALVLGFCLWAGASRAELTMLQNGTAPTQDYAGCKDTWISDGDWERNRDNGRSPTLRCGGKRAILIQFDLSPIPKDHTIHKALLWLADVEFPRPRDGKWPVTVLAWRLIRDWNDNANWLEHTRTNYKAADAGDWKTPGGELDAETDFAQGEKGLIASDALRAVGGGHIHDLDITAIVQLWHAGKLPNHGLALVAPPKSHGCHVASSQWYVPSHRPALLVYHGPKGAAPSTVAPPEEAPKDIALDPIAQTPDAGKAQGDYAPVRVGQNSSCALRGATTDAYIKEAVERFPGTWGWMTMCRAGGVAGDLSHALLYFDLKDIPRHASVQSAKLHLSLVPQTSRQATEYRYGAFLLKLPESPGWSPAEVTALECKAGVPWPRDFWSCVGTKPVALGKAITRKEKDRTILDAMEFDLTGAVRAWVQGKVPNCGIVLDNRIEGGAYDFHSSRSFDPKLRPYLEISLSPAIPKDRLKAELQTVTPGLPPGDYWVEPMREAHKRFKGKPGTLAQYGDSITVTMAYLAGYSWAGKIQPKNCLPDVQKEMDAVAAYSDLKLWRTWKGGEWGNTGMMKSDWLINNIDGWQKKMNPEVSVILFGTNDLGSLCPPEYTENMAASVRRMLADGTVPMLTTVPPASGRPIAREYWLAGLSIAHGLKVPVIDYYAEIMRRRPDDWDGRLEKFGKPRDGYQVPTLISGDGTHPSNPKQFVGDFSDEALNSSGYTLRDYMTLRTYYQVIAKVVRPEAK
ncbi:MAG TPA: DNRLRE domain-containing protein [Planctomycetota bacterium]|nr:DNRLRE domain-containing protein [Planctomycetota bacterium]